jgi:ubiquinone biosynthesis protein UbiJ
MAEQVQDAPGRERALSRAADLPRLLAGPSAPSSRQFAQAQALFAAAIGDEQPADVRIPRLEQTIEQIGELADQAPVREAGAILRLNSPLVRLIEHLQSSTG